MHSLMPQPARVHYPGYAVKANGGAHVLDTSDTKRANTLQQKFNQSDKRTCLVDKSDSENSFVAIPSSRGDLRLYLVSDGVGTAPLAQSSMGVLYSSVRLHKEKNNDWLVCDKGVMQVPKAAVGDREGRASVENADGGVNSYKHFQEISGESAMQRVPYGNFDDVQKIEFAQRLLQACEMISKTGWSVETVIRPETVRFLGDGKEIVFINDACAEKTPEGAKVKGTNRKDAYHFPEDSDHSVSQEQKHVLACAIFFMNLFSDRPEDCSAANVRFKEGGPYVERKEHLMMKRIEKIDPEVRSSCIQLFKDMSSSRASARLALSACLKRLSEQADLYSAIVQSIESKESYERQCRENMHSLQQQIDKVSKSTVLDKSAKDSQLALLEQQLVEAKLQLSKYEQVNKENEEALKQKHQALEMQKSESRKLKEENDGLLQEHEELERQLREAAEKVKDLGGQSRKIQQDAREKQDALKADKKLCEERALQLQEELSGKQKSYDGVALRLEEEKKARQVSEQRYQELKKQVLEEMKSFASNEPGKKADFMNNISGAVLAWPLPERIQLLDDLCCSIILNKDGSYRHRGNSQSYRPVNFTQTQIDQINMLRAEALKAAIAMLNKAMLDGDDSLKFKACKYLDESLVVHFQPTHSLQSWDSGCQGDCQKLLAKTPEIWMFRDHVEKGKCHPLQVHFQDGRAGDKSQDKKLTDYMKRLANAGVEVAGKELYEEISDRSIVDKTKILDGLFRHVCFRLDAYTRSTKGVQASAGGYLSYVAGNQIRGDVAEPTETRNKHAEFLQGAFRQMLQDIKKSEKPLSRDEIAVLSKSLLTKYIPGQYQHEVTKQVAPLLALETQSIFELEYNFDSWKQYIEEEFSVKFS